jgi:hypothetical protein
LSPSLKSFPLGESFNCDSDLFRLILLLSAIVCI